MADERPVVVVGAGVAGLACALHLARSGLRALLLEADEAPGGRVRSDRVEGFCLDRGFQVLLTAYPEARSLLDYRSLRLCEYAPGAKVFHGGRLRTLADPLRRPGEALATLGSGLATPGDALRVLRLRAELARTDLEALLAAPERSTRDELERRGFSPGLIGRFFRPFFAGVFLESELATSSRFFAFSFAMFARGAAAVPDAGMQAIPDQLAARLPEGTLRLGARVARLGEGEVELVSGERLAARAVVLATDAAEAARLAPGGDAPDWNAVGCLHWEAPAPPVRGPWLVLDGDGTGPVNNLCVPSEVAPGYAPAGRTLVSASVLGPCKEDDDALDRAARAQLREWFGPTVETWRLLRVDRIERALPRLEPGDLEARRGVVRPAPDLFVCGDHRALPSLNGALRSGRLAAHAVAGDVP